MSSGYIVNVPELIGLAKANDRVATNVDGARRGIGTGFEIPAEAFGDSAAAGELHAAHQLVVHAADQAVRDIAGVVAAHGVTLRDVAVAYERGDEQSALSYLGVRS